LSKIKFTQPVYTAALALDSDESDSAVTTDWDILNIESNK